MKKFLIPLLILIISFNGCTKEEENQPTSCPQVDLGEFYLLKSSLNSYPYSKDEATFKFSDSSNNEIAFRLAIAPVDSHLVSWYGRANNLCHYDNSMIEFIARAEYYKRGFYSIDEYVELDYEIILHVDFRNDSSIFDSDVLSIFKQYPQPNDASRYSVMDILINQRNNPSADYMSNWPKSIPTILLNKKIFKDVYTSYENDLYFNFEYGIIAVRDSTNKLWVLK